MKKALIICGAVILVLVIGFLGYLLADTRSELSSAKNDLNTKIDELVSLTSQMEQTGTDLKNATEELNKTNDDLDKEINNLSLTKKELSDTKNELDSTKNDLSTARSEIDELNTQYTIMKSSYDGINTSLENARKDLESANTTIEQLNKDIDLYKETFGAVYQGINPSLMIPDNSTFTFDTRILPSEGLPAKRQVNLVNNPKARNPSSRQLLDFLAMDITDKNRYLLNYYERGNFAETIHNKAEATGIKAAFVIVTLDNGQELSLNAFFVPDTPGRKLTYIDSTGYFDKLRPYSMDTSLPTLKIGNPYIRVPISDPNASRFIHVDYGKVTSIKIYW